MNRGCGKRKPGGVYICTKLSTHGVPLEEFIIDPPRPYEGERFRAPTIFEKDGVCHLLFWVGKAFYPFPSDFIEEVRRFGASKRVPVDFPIEKLSAGSLMFFVHPRAIIKNHNLLPPPPRCPKGFPDHLSNETYCLGHSYQVAPANDEGRRKIGDTVYSVTTVTTEGPLEFSPGIFLRLPITDIDHVLYKDGKADPRVKEREVKIPLNYTME
ncbi:MAG: hypothetical protein ABSC55_27415 [Syntrophorhabdales bacterium]|jgi:hypothetical protein